MKKVMDSFMNEHEKNFDEFFFKHIELYVKDREDYIETGKIRHGLMKKYPRIMTLFDRDRVDEFTDEENEALLDVIRAESDRIIIERKEAFKLGFKEAFIFFKENGMLKI